MIYITVKQSPAYHQLTLEELLFDTYHGNFSGRTNTTNTRTYERTSVSNKFGKGVDVWSLIEILSDFNKSTESLHSVERIKLYDSFKIPKKSGGLRSINAPKPELMDALRKLKIIFEEQFHALYHTSAFAYIRGRCTIDAIKRHQSNESKWFAKLDLHDFFGSTTLDFVMQMFSMIYPFSELMIYPAGKEALQNALELAFLNGGLPQGTPISPLITNIMMIPIDYKLTNGFREFDRQRFIYTRYADDFIISSRYDFDIRKMEKFVKDTLTEFNAPFSLNSKKTRYGSSAGSNWNLGVMLNKDNEITIGHKKKRHFKSMLHNYIVDRKNGVQWDKEDLYAMQGLYSYYAMVEKNTIDAIINHINEKMAVNVMEMIKNDLQ